MHVELYKSPEDKQWHWKAIADNGEIVASGEAYKNKTDAKAIVKALFPTTEIREATTDAVPRRKKSTVSRKQTVRSPK